MTQNKRGMHTHNSTRGVVNLYISTRTGVQHEWFSFELKEWTDNSSNVEVISGLLRN